MNTRSIAVMSEFLIYAVFFAVLIGANVSAALRDPIILQVTDNQNLLGSRTEHKFKAFIEEYGKEYSTREEYLHRLGVFARNLIRAVELQVLDPTALHGITPFSDLTDEEFQSTYLGVKPVGGSNLDESNGVASLMEVSGLPDSFDWREKGAVTAVKTQKSCGSCWAFSTTGAIEGANFIATGKLLNLSEQQLVDCDHTCDSAEKDSCDNGCSGGLMTNAYKYLIDVGGIESEDAYPYTGKAGECKFNADKRVVKIANFTTVPMDEAQIQANLVHNGPLAIGLNAAFMKTYIGGVSCPLICMKNFVNHGVLLVGYGSKGFSILRLGYRPYWIIKNSWGSKWGENGYYRLCRGHGMCGMNTMVSAVVTATATA